MSRVGRAARQPGLIISGWGRPQGQVQIFPQIGLASGKLLHICTHDTHMVEMRDVLSSLYFPAVPVKFMSSNKSSYARSLNATKGDFLFRCTKFKAFIVNFDRLRYKNSQADRAPLGQSVARTTLNHTYTHTLEHTDTSCLIRKWKTIKDYPELEREN